MGRGVIKGLRNVLGHAGLWELHLHAVAKRIWISSAWLGAGHRDGQRRGHGSICVQAWTEEDKENRQRKGY